MAWQYRRNQQKTSKMAGGEKCGSVSGISEYARLAAWRRRRNGMAAAAKISI